MKKKQTKKKQVIEIHIYVHQNSSITTYPPIQLPSTSEGTTGSCPYCGKWGPHVCTTYGTNKTY